LIAVGFTSVDSTNCGSKIFGKLHVMAYTCNLSTQEVDAGGTQFEAIWTTQKDTVSE
jgi:hypothetical protein